MMKILPNNVAVIEGDTHFAVWCATEGLKHDKFMAPRIEDLIRNNGAKVAVDVGANIGTLCRSMLDAGAEVHAFEPNPEAVACLRHNCAEAKIYEYGLSDREESAVLCLSPNVGASHVDCVRPGISSTEQPDPVIMLTRLDNLPIDPDFIKMDIEGYEVKALRGAKETIARCRPKMVIEVNAGALVRAGSSPKELFDLLSEYGYVFQIMQSNCSWTSPQFDLFCLPL